MKKTIFLIILIIPALIIGAGFFSMTEGGIEDIVICSTSDKSHYIPSSVCEYYLLNYRLTETDIKAIESGSGLAFLFGISNKPKRNKFLEYFISKGVSIDKPSNIDGFTPLHAAILENDKELVEYLLGKGADPLKVDRDNKLTAIDFLDRLIKSSPDTNRKGIKRVLTDALNTKN